MVFANLSATTIRIGATATSASALAAESDQRPSLIFVLTFKAPIRRTSLAVNLSGNRSMISVFDSPSMMPEKHALIL